VPDRTVLSQPSRHHPALISFAFTPGTGLPMTRDDWLFAISIAWICVLLYAGIFVLFLR
jgi:hypothetical protein